jgi:hypothetical protein
MPNAPGSVMVARQSVKAKARPVRRRDRPGHIDPRFAANLRKNTSKPPRDEDEGFVTGSASDDPLGEELGEAVVRHATGGDNEIEELDQAVPEETGGPFVSTSAGEEFADDYDASNPPGSTREPFPKT